MIDNPSDFVVYNPWVIRYNGCMVSKESAMENMTAEEIREYEAWLELVDSDPNEAELDAMYAEWVAHHPESLNEVA